MSIFSDVVGFFGHQAQKKQASKSIGDYAGARDQSLTAATGARDSTLAGYQTAQDTALPVFQNSLNAGVSAYQPYSQAGGWALDRNTAMQQPGFQYSPSDPSYQFRFDQGVNALDRSAAANGSLGSGGQQKALTRYGQGMASTEFQADFNRNQQMAQLGMQGAQGTAGAYDNYGRYVGNALYQTAQGGAAANQNYAGNVENALFKSADGMAGARQAKGDAIAAQFGDGAKLGTDIASAVSGVPSGGGSGGDVAKFFF